MRSFNLLSNRELSLTPLLHQPCHSGRADVRAIDDTSMQKDTCVSIIGTALGLADPTITLQLSIK